MNKDKADLLVATLRSGEFSQTKGALKNNKGFCCLGVACELYRRETGNGNWLTDGNEDLYVVGKESERGALPKSVQNWLGTRSANPSTSVTREDFPLSLAELNDDGWSFEKIADLIEREWKFL
jgi:hypothetical protein